MSEFELRIKLNSETMKSGGNVAAALIDVARRILNRETLTPQDEGKIIDSQGVAVGEWKVEKP